MPASLNPICLLRDEPRVTSDCKITMDDLQPESPWRRTDLERATGPGNSILLQASLIPGI